MEMQAPELSVCIVTRRRHALLGACLDSLVAQDMPPPFEVLVGADRDMDVEAVIHARFPDAEIVHVERGTLGAVRNLLIPRARGELLFFLDDDVVAQPSLLAELAYVATHHPDVDVFGGPNETPPHSTHFQVVQGAVLASLIGSGPVRKRYGQHPPGPANERFFTLCNLAVRRSAMLQFPPELTGGEENATLLELHARGHRMYYDPDLYVFHERRATVRGFARQMLKYGRGRGEVVARDPKTVRPEYVAPTALLAYLALAPVLARRSRLALVPLALYSGAVAAQAAKIAIGFRKRSLQAGVIAAGLIPLVHACYGVGFLAGLEGRSRR